VKPDIFANQLVKISQLCRHRGQLKNGKDPETGERTTTWEVKR